VSGVDLVEWLGKQLDEDERIAREASERSAEWRLVSPLDDAELGDAWWLNPPEKYHAERHDPARVLREVDAKRRLLAIHRPYVPEPDQACLGCAGGIMFTACPVIPLLALPYADQPGYAEALTSAQ
jgi:hypothetical protein